MKKSILALSIVASSLLLLAGCGSSNNDNEKKTTTGTGYYLDSAVAGVNYTCGSKTGTTDADGTFIFEKGKDCTFEVAGVTLKSVPAENLVDKVKVVEESNVTAAFLQSLDNDGDPANGIQITPKVIEILTKALQDAKITTVPNDQELSTVVSEIDQKDDNYHGHKVTEDQAQQHLDTTQESVVKDLLTGKTFYVVGSEDGAIKIFKFVVSSNGATYKQYNLDGTLTDDDSITYNGDKVTIGTGGGYIKLTQKDGYILGQGYQDDGSLENGMGHRLYTSKADAQKYYDSLSSSNSSQDLKSLIVGKTYYTVVKNVDPHHVEILEFKDDGKTMLDTWPKEGKEVTSTFTYSIANGTLHIKGTSGGDEKKKIDTDIMKEPITQTDTYIKGANGGHLYKTYDAASQALDNDDGSSTSEGSGNSNAVVGSYTQNGNDVTITRAQANMNHAETPIFQFNLKHDIGDHSNHKRDMVQISSVYTSKQDFDNSFSNNSLVLSFSNNNLQDVGMEIADKGWVGHDSVSNDFQVTVTKNADGTYNVTSQGSFTADGNDIAGFHCENIAFDNH